MSMPSSSAVMWLPISLYSSVVIFIPSALQYDENKFIQEDALMYKIPFGTSTIPLFKLTYLEFICIYSP